MYQIKRQCGYEIQGIGRGENGLCRVADHDGRIVYSGTYAQCDSWLRERGVR